MVEKKIVPIAFAFGNNWMLPACVCLSSLLQHANSTTFYDVFILYSPNEEINRQEIEQVVVYYGNARVKFLKVDHVFDNSYEIRGINTIAYYRLLIPDLVPEYDKIIYSDVDVIFREDLAKIFEETDLEDNYIAGVNSLSYLVPEIHNYYYKLGLDSQKIIYSGNIILNSKLLREDGVVNVFRNMAGKKYKYQDMDILNVVCNNRILYMPPSFCTTTYFFKYAVHNPDYLRQMWSNEEIDYALEKGILHYNGKKPWIQYSINFDIWWEYYRKSPVFSEKCYFDYFYNRLNIFDQLSLWKRIKLVLRYFVFGIRNY